MKKVKFAIISLLALTGLLTPITVPTFAAAQISPEAKQAACEGLGDGSCDGSSAGNSIASLLSTVVNILSWIIGIVAVIMVIIGGFKLVTSNGDSNSVASARSTIIYALVGLVVAALAQVLVRFVLSNI